MQNMYLGSKYWLRGFTFMGPEMVFIVTQIFWKFVYRTRAIINRGYYFFSLFCDVGFSLMFGGIPLKLRGY